MKHLVAAYFTGELNIPSISGSSYAETENLALLTKAIKKYEAKFLQGLLGDALYALYAAAFATIPAITSGIYFDLNAQIYSEDSASGLYESLAANYVYFHFWKFNQSVTLRSGEAGPKQENSEVISMNYKLVQIWNEMSRKAYIIREWIKARSSSYPTYSTVGQEDYSPLTPFC